MFVLSLLVAAMSIVPAHSSLFGPGSFQVYLPIGPMDRLATESLESECELGSLVVKFEDEHGRSQIRCHKAQVSFAGEGPHNRLQRILNELRGENARQMRANMALFVRRIGVDPYVQHVRFAPVYIPTRVEFQPDRDPNSAFHYGKMDFIPVRIEVVTAIAALTPPELEQMQSLSVQESDGNTRVLGFVSQVNLGVAYDVFLKNAKVTRNPKGALQPLVEADDLIVPLDKVYGTTSSTNEDPSLLKKAFQDQDVEQLRAMVDRITTTTVTSVKIHPY